MPKVAVIVGSIRKDSINRKLAAALERLGSPRLQFERVKIDDLPLFNQDDENNPTPAVTRIKDQLAAADAVLFVTPEHNRSVPAAMKNVVDWATRPYGKSSLKGKVAAVIGTSRGNISTASAQMHLKTILSEHVIALLGNPAVYVHFTDGLIDDSGNISEEKIGKSLQTYMDRFADLIAALPKRS